MKIEHIAIWVNDLEGMRDFYVKFFEVSSNDMYHNPNKNFSSYFLSFQSGPRIELMHRPDILFGDTKEKLGLVHMAISVGSEERVNQLTERLREHGISIVGEPRTTGDGYYESVVADPEGNLIELTV